MSPGGRSPNSDGMPVLHKQGRLFPSDVTTCAGYPGNTPIQVTVKQKEDVCKPKTGTLEWADVNVNFLQAGPSHKWKCRNNCTYCIDEDTPVLMSDLSETKIKNVKIGDKIIGVVKSDTNLYKTCEGIVLVKTNTIREGYEIHLNDGRKLICSEDHRWLSTRGWKYTTQGKQQRPHLTPTNELRFLYYPDSNYEETEDYKCGYLRGLIDGDGILKQYPQKTRNNPLNQFRIVLKDIEPLNRASSYLQQFGVNVDWFQFNSYMKGIRTADKQRFMAIQRIIQLKDTPDFLRGYVGGFFDAEGSHSKNIIRFADTKEDHRNIAEQSLLHFNFDYIREEHKTINKIMYGLRIRGTHSEQIRFFQTFNPAIIRKRMFVGNRVSYNSKILSITPLNRKIKMVDIQTDCENFVANGVISHNCYARKNAVRFGQIEDSTECGEPIIKRPSLPSDSKVMMPSSHDLFPEHLDTIIDILNKLLLKGNSVLLVSKPRKEVITEIIRRVKAWQPEWQARVEFRFSITSASNEISLRYEPGASLPQERVDCLKLVLDAGFPASVSMEPYLEAPGAMMQLICSALHPRGMGALKEWWLGALNYGAPPELRHLYTKQYMADCVRIFKEYENCRFKDSFQKAFGIDCRGGTIK